MINQINDLAKSLDSPGTTLKISKDLYEDLKKVVFPKERTRTYGASNEINQVHTENGVLEIQIVDGQNFIEVT